MRRLPNPWVAVPVLGAMAAGWFVGSTMAGVGCDDGCGAARFIAGLVGAVVGGAGVLVVVILAIRSLAEWHQNPRPPGQDPGGPPSC